MSNLKWNVPGAYCLVSSWVPPIETLAFGSLSLQPFQHFYKAANSLEVGLAIEQ